MNFLISFSLFSLKVGPPSPIICISLHSQIRTFSLSVSVAKEDGKLLFRKIINFILLKRCWMSSFLIRILSFLFFFWGKFLRKEEIGENFEFFLCKFFFQTKIWPKFIDRVWNIPHVSLHELNIITCTRNYTVTVSTFFDYLKSWKAAWSSKMMKIYASPEIQLT